MPRIVANLVTLAGLLVLAATMQQGSDTPIFVIGQFLVLLQLVKLYEQRANRDYAQILILNLLQMVSAAISTAALVFGVLFLIYLVVALYCCLLFHLKVETDAVRQAKWYWARRDGLAGAGIVAGAAAAAAPIGQYPQPSDRQPMRRSLFRVTSILSVVGVACAIFMFFFFPRGASSGLIGPLQLNPNESLTGFSEHVNFQNVAMISQNTQTIAWVKVHRGSEPYQGVLMLRGLTLDTYTGSGGEESFQWTRTPPRDFRSLYDAQSYELSGDRGVAEDPTSMLIRQEVTLAPTGTTAIFALGGIVRFKPDDPRDRFRFSPQDQVIQSDEPLYHRINYVVDSSSDLTVDSWPPRYLGNSRIDPKIEEFARRPEVSGSDELGPLAARRPPRSREMSLSPPTALDVQIAHNIETYLRENYLYSTDLTDARRIKDQDPMVAFLYDLKRGHCEYFAGAMALMCQSLGLHARVVVGFRCDEYNPIFDYYNVRQSHAHAWVEVLDGRGHWQTYDPTSGNEAVSARPDGLGQRLRAILGYLEYSWENGVIAYDQSRQGDVVLGVERSLRRVGDQASRLTGGIADWWQNLRDSVFPRMSFNILSAMIAMIPLAFVAPIVWYLVDQWRLRRRARRIGLDTLPPPEKIKLARQLGFYDELLRLLERHHIVRPPHLTPLEFSGSLTFLPTDAFGSIRFLTEVFYRVRYGREDLTPDERRRLDGVIGEVETMLGAGIH
jgi:transglutaminase-like putative cysteine protease